MTRTITVTSNRVADEDIFDIGVDVTDVEAIDLMNASHFLVQTLSENTDIPINDILDTLKTFAPTGEEQLGTEDEA